MELDNATPLNESVLQSQNQKKQHAVQVLEALRKEALENDCEWLAENLDVSKQAVKERTGVQ